MSQPHPSTQSAGGSRPADVLDLTLPAKAESIGRLRRAASEFAVRHGVARPIDVALAVTEACTNVVLHAYRDLPLGTLHLAGSLDPERVCLVVTDEGRGLTPDGDSPGLGLGLAIIAQVTTFFQIADRSPTGTVVTMGFGRLRPA